MPSVSPPPAGGGVESEERRRLFYWGIGTESQCRSGTGESSPCVRGCGVPWPFLLGQVSIRDRMDRLHRRDHAKPREPWLVIGVDPLGGLESRAPPPPCPPLGLQ